MKTILLLILVCALAVVPAGANSNAAAAQQLSTEARELKTMANDVATQLNNKSADIAVAASRLEQIKQRATEITRLIGEIENSGLTLDTRRTQELNRLKKLGVTLNLFVENKRQILESGGAEAQRNLLRSQVLGVAVRADMIEKSVRKLGL